MDALALAQRLDRAAWDLGNRGLEQAARWAVEAATGTGLEYAPHPPPILSPLAHRAKRYLSNREVARAYSSLKDAADSESIFIKYYARYLHGELVAEEAQQDLFLGSRSPNPYLLEILTALDNVLEDPHLLYLKACVLRRQNQIEEALKVLVNSVELYPFNWSAWLEIVSCTTSWTESQSLFSGAGKTEDFQLMLRFFNITCAKEYNRPGNDVIDDILVLRQIFPQFYFVKLQEALVAMSDFEETRARQLFEELFKEDPTRLDEMDVYSNMLYINEERDKLAYIAQAAIKVDRYRAETCCIIANWYSLKGEHERAVSFYQRALTLNRDYLSAWTLMGHEYIELKNTHAAIESYRAAVDLSPRDFRAWYGLGQAYEVLGNCHYGLYYYQRALGLRPMDPRMWTAAGSCHEQLGQLDDAAMMYEQGLRVAGQDAFLSHKLGLTYEKLERMQKAINHMEEATHDPEESEWQPRSRLWLARNCLKNKDWEAARRHALLVVEGPPQVLEDARSVAWEASNQLKMLP